MQWSDLIGPVSGALIAFVGLWRSQVMLRGTQARSESQTATARESGAASVVPQLMERLEAQDRRIEAMRAEVDACEERSTHVARELAMAQAALERALVDLEEARRQIAALVALLPAADRERVRATLRPSRGTD